MRNLEAELLFARQRIQTIIENYETGQQELNASNEELRSANEELRSAMEELETSKEELQSANEELHTVNQENRHKVEELAQLSTDLQNLLAATDIATIFLDRDLRILRFTPKVSRLFNIRLTDRGRPLLHLTHRLGYEQLEQDAREVLDQLVPVEREVQDNEQRWYLVRVLPYRAVQDRIAGIVITLIDITSRKRIEEVLRKSEEFQRLAIEAGGIGTWDFDLRAEQCVISLKMAELLGYAPIATVLSRASWLASVVPEVRDGMEARLNASAKSGAPFEMTFRVQTKDGLVRWLYTRGAISANDGNSLHMHGASIDITARLQAESALRQSEQRFRALVDVSAAMVWTTNADGTTTEDSPSWRAFTGQTYEIWTSRGWLNAVHADDRAQVESAWRRSLESGTPLMSECRVFNAPSGEYRWTSVRAVPLHESDGGVGGWVGMHIDISELKEADRRKDEFLATLAHELRNPLAPLRTSLAILGSGKADSGVIANETRIMNRQLAHMVHLVDDLLDLTRISQGKIVLRKTPVPIASVIQSAIEAVRPAFDEQKGALEVALPSQPLYVDGDEIRLAQVISNLLSNAAKFSQAGGRIWVAVEPEGAEIVIRVRDEGIGIPDDKLRDIFQMFTQVEQSAERVRTGLGIGLSLAKQLVELHDGSISVRSEGRGKGSEFTVHLPLCPFDRPAEPTQVPDALPNVSLTGLRVLIADDNRDAVETLADLLRMHGSEVAIAGDGAAALDRADALRPEVVLFDIGMPKADGYEVCRRLRTRPATSSATIIALSGWGQEEHRRKARESGFDDYQVKPVEYAALVASLQRLRKR